MSSKTAAPSRVRPTRVRSTFSSIRVWAEMLTLVADRARPMKSASVWLRPNASAVPKPRIRGTTTPKVPERDAALPELSISARSSSRPASIIKSNTPISAISSITSPRCVSSSNTGQVPNILRKVGPRMMPAINSPNTAGWPSRVLM